jgi:hypothetical protein
MRRRLIAALLAGVAVLSGLLVLSPPAGTQVLVAARDLAPGVLRPGDLTLTELTPPPDGALRAPVPGQVLAAPMRKGEPLTDARLLHSVRLQPGLVAVPVRIADADAARLLSAGSRIGVLAAWADRPAHLVADDVTVVSVPPSQDDHGALVVLAATPAQAAQLATAQAGGRLSVTLKTHLL